MDNKLVVGVGNIYASESLFSAGIHPDRLASSLSREECEQLVKVIKLVLLRSIEQGGTTLKDFLQSDGKPGYFAQELQVYGRKGRAVPFAGRRLSAVNTPSGRRFIVASARSKVRGCREPACAALSRSWGCAWSGSPDRCATSPPGKPRRRRITASSAAPGERLPAESETSPWWRATSFTSEEEINDHSFAASETRSPASASNDGSYAPAASHIQNLPPPAGRELKYSPAARGQN